jgi:enterochelin esterase-like enzyme
MPAWSASKIYPGTTREWAIYVPAQYKPDGSAALMVFQDGMGYTSAKGNWRVPIVFDNLIARGEMPVTVAIFINPGNDPSKGSAEKRRERQQPQPRIQRPRRPLHAFPPRGNFARSREAVSVHQRPEKRAIAGSSSGAIAAFTVAWERPDQFRKVLSTIGSFVNLDGRRRLPGPHPQNGAQTASAFSSKTAAATSTIPSATGPPPTRTCTPPSATWATMCASISRKVTATIQPTRRLDLSRRAALALAGRKARAAPSSPRATSPAT